jgi:parvulin-like peptidyl-prolyl isomerase
LKALAALSALKSSGDWDQVVDDFSDSGKSTHGALGRIGRQDVTTTFADAAFALEVDELSYVVETDRGFHVILRTQ